MIKNPSFRQLCSRWFCAVLVLFAASRADAIIDVNLQMQLGNPSGATVDPTNRNHYLVQRTVEALDYSDLLGEPVWVSWDLTTADVGSAQRSNNYQPDTNLPPLFYEVTDGDYVGVGAINFNRGHMCPSEDRTDTTNDNILLFLMSNIIPQAATNNQGVWGTFEGQCRTFANAGNELLITCGPSGFTTNKIPSGKAYIANYTWKVVVIVPLGAGSALSRITAACRVIALKIPNSNSVSSTWQTYVTNAATIEADTGFTFFSALPPNIATVFRNEIDGVTPPAPTIAGFLPSSAPVNTTVTITGTNFVYATNVTFNGVAATFTINSSTNITATVPSGATTGKIVVAGLGGQVTSAANFTVNTSSSVDLAVSVSHSGNFTQGDTADTYTITVTNTGSATSGGAVNVTNILPSGLTATAISGSGWTTTLGTVSATRSDALIAGAAYAPITVTVSVATNAPTLVTNTATVSGGNDSNSANNTATDPTVINAIATPTVVTGSPSNLGATTVTLNGTVNPNSLLTTAYFDYGTTTNYGSTASVAGTFTGTTTQAASANVTLLLTSTTYHFRLNATNSLGLVHGADQSFTTASSVGADITLSLAHPGIFTQGDTNDTYTIIVTNIGNSASSGTITVVDTLPAGLTATAVSGSGWTTNLATLTFTRSDALAGGAAYAPITITVSVATNAPGSVTNIAAVSGGSDTNTANNTVNDITIISPPNSAATNVVISQVYGAGGNASATYQNDFVELFNPLSVAVNLSTWSVQYASSTGSSWSGNKVNLTGSIQPHRYYLIMMASQAAIGSNLPPADVTNTSIQMSASNGKIALVSSQTALTGNNPIGSNTVVDFIGFGTADFSEGGVAAPAPANSATSLVRKNGGYTDSNNNGADFASQSPPTPRNSSSPANVQASADLVVTLSHSITFTQGDSNDTYTITVTNSGAGATVGSVSVAESLPTGLTATAITGSGWSANLGTLTATRSDVLSAGTSYPQITVTVSVATNAPASVTNTVIVSGGGETNTANNSASDMTAIIALAPVQSWRLQYFGTTANAGAAADTNIVTSDGMPNLLKYALGLNPLVPTNSPVVGDISTGHLRLTTPKNPNATDVSFYIEATSIVTSGWTTNGTTVDQNTASLLQVHDNTVVGPGSRYMRLRITRP